MAIFEAFALLKAAFTKFAGTQIGAFVVRASASLILSQIATALAAPPVRAEQDASNERVTSLDGNVLQAGSAIPRVLGSQRVYPPLLSEPLYYFDAGQEVVEAVYALAGPHDLENVLVNGSPVDGLAGVEVATRDGTRRQRAQRMIRRYGFTESPNAELAAHRMQSDGVTLDLSTGDTATAAPQAQVYRKVALADEFWLQVTFAGGLHREASDADPVRVPFRIRIRRVGATAWRNLPELHYRGRSHQIKRATIRLIWQDAMPVVKSGAGDGFVQALAEVPGQAAAPVGGWACDGWFDDGAGDAWLQQNNAASTRLRRMQMDTYEARFYLDPAEFAPGEWDVEIVRGAPFRDSLFAVDGYTYSGTVRDWFGYYGTPPRIAENRAPIQDACQVVRAVSVVNQTPTPDNRLAVIAIRARGVTVQKLSVLAHGLVRSWDGADWVPLQRSDNPADIYRDILLSRSWANPFLRSDIDDDTLQEWWDRCDENGWACNGVIEDVSVPDALRIAAGAGYARPILTTKASVIQDYDRSAEAPVHIFTPRNSRGLVWQQSRGDLPTGLRVVYRDAESVQREIVVLADPSGHDYSRLEQVEYESIQTDAEAEARALYDLRSGEYRRTVYGLSAPPAQLALLPGSLVGVVSDELSDVMASGVITPVQTQAIGVNDNDEAYYIVVGGVNTAFYVIRNNVLDTYYDSLGVPNFADAETMDEISDMRRDGAVLAVSVQLDDGSWATYEAGPYQGRTNVLLIDAPESVLRPGAEVAIGMLGEPERMVILDIAPDADLSAQITLVPDASAEIWGGL